MAMAQANPEPSMEDILASIKRIIAEDSEPPAPRAPRTRRDLAASGIPAPEPEVMQERERAVEQPEPDRDAEAEPEAVAQGPDHVDILELTSPLAEPEPPSRRESTPSMDSLMSNPAAEASRSAFAALAQLQVRAETGQENTLEGLVGDLLRPMLREWLDRELPALVERMVAAEIGRISGRG